MLKNLIKRIITGFVLGVLFWTAFIYTPPIVTTMILLTILGLIICFEWTRLLDVHKAPFWLLMPIYPVLPFALLIFMNHNPLYRNLLFILFIIVFSYDTGAYIVGNLIGRWKIAPTISPGKTAEGFVGGFFFACIGLSLTLWELDISKTMLFIPIFAFVVCVLSLTGDLFESWLKRRARVKDSGTLLPGHGGFLDRFDGILFAVFFFFLLKDHLINLFGL